MFTTFIVNTLEIYASYQIGVTARAIGVDSVPLAFLLISVEIDSEKEILELMKRIEGVEEAHMVYGVYDIIAKIKADTTARLKDTILWRIRKLNKVRSTTTMMVSEESEQLCTEANT